jgi:signal transduction histidine kinase
VTYGDPIIDDATSVTPAGDGDIEHKIASERAELLYASPLPMSVALILALSLSAMLWGVLPHWAIFGWLTFAAVTILVRMRLRKAFLASDRQHPAVWLERYALGAFALGLIWSLTGIVIWISDDALSQVAVIVVAYGMTSGAVGANCAYTPAVDRFIWPPFLMISGGLAWQGDRIHVGLALLGMLYICSLTIVSRVARRTIINAIRTKYEKQALADRLAAALTEVEASGRAKSSFLATMSHELRTPLNAIIGFSEMLNEQRHGPLGANQYRDYVRDIHHSGKHLLDLVNDILDLTKIEAGRMDLREELVDTGELVPICCRMLRQKAEQGGVAIETRVLPGLNPMRADRAKVRQILFNLVSNAIKFTPSGGQVVVSAEPCPGGGIALAVADTGIGIAPEEIPLALQPFRQIDNTLSRVHQGTGLGLPLAKALVELHGGSLDIVSQPNVGTTVTVTFPADRVVALATIGEAAARPSAS